MTPGTMPAATTLPCQTTTTTTPAEELLAGLQQLREQLARIEAKVDAALRGQARKDWYTTAEVAARMGVAEDTVREWCRFGRVRAEKRKSGQGPARPWMIADAELDRLRNEGLRPLRIASG